MRSLAIDTRRLMTLRGCRRYRRSSRRPFVCGPRRLYLSAARRRLTSGRRAGGDIEGGVKLARANDLFISMYNMGRSPQLWKDPDVFDPQRWDRPFDNPE